MKDENKTLRSQISSLRQEAPPSTEKQLEEKMHELNTLKHKLDAVTNEAPTHVLDYKEKVLSNRRSLCSFVSKSQ